MIAIIKYNAGNSTSVKNALQRLGYAATITDNPEVIRNAEKVIFPGVGEASSAMRYLKERQLDTLITSLEQPVLGVCLGLQLLCKYSEEGNTPCLGIFNSEVKRFPQKAIVPHMGWNNFHALDGTLTTGIQVQDSVYYVHSYYATVSEDTQSSCDYIVPFSSTLEKNNFYASQFHPEKSGTIGAQILQNFLAL